MNIKKKILNLPGVKRIQTEYIGLQYRNEEKKRHNNYESLVIPEGIDKPLVSIIILNRNGKKNFEILLPSLDKCAFYDKFELIIVDNASSDDSLSYVEQWKDRFDITIIRNQTNESFSAANNKGAEIAKGAYYLFLNNDTRVTDGWLDELLRTALEQDNVGAVGARLIYPKIPSDSVNKGKSYKIQHAGICFRDKVREKLYFIQPYNMGNGRRAIEPVTGCKERPCVTAAVMLVSREAFEEVSGFDEKYIYGYEDVDICLKLYKAGYHNYYCADSLVFHYEFGTQSKDDKKEVTERRRHNMEVFKGKWQRYLFRQIYKDKLGNIGFFTEAKFSCKLVMPEGDSSKEIYSLFQEAFTKRGYHLKCQLRDDEKQYDIGVGTDLLICLDPEYDIRSLTNIKNDLITVAWIDENKVRWEKKTAENDYSLLVKDNLGDFDDKIEYLMSYLRRFSEFTINEKEIDICGAMPDNDTIKFWGDYHYALALKKEFEKRGYAANILTRENWYNCSSAKYTIVLRGLKAYYPCIEDGRKNIMWNISHPADVSISEYELYDHVFFASERMKEMLAPKINVKSGVLYQCTDPEIMNAEEREKRFELLFVGNSRHVFRKILKDLLPTDYKLSVYGRHWEDYPVIDYVVQDYIDNNEVGQAYHDAVILLNDHWDDMKEYGLISNRIFDALSAGAFVISDDVPGLQEMLQDSVVTYTTREDLKQKIDYYMTHDEEREKKVCAGRKIVRKNHTFSNRVDTLLSTAFD